MGAGAWTGGRGGAVGLRTGLLRLGACRSDVRWGWPQAAACVTSWSERLMAGRGVTLLIGS